MACGVSVASLQSSATDVVATSPRYELSPNQILRLAALLTNKVKVAPKVGSYPTLFLSPLSVVKLVRQRLEDSGILIELVTFQGSGASFCLAEEHDRYPRLQYKDIDIVYYVNRYSLEDLDIIREVVVNSLLEFFPASFETGNIKCWMLENAYIKKRAKVSYARDQWSLLAFGDENGMNIELKFVHRMTRKYVFSLDSFHIILEPTLCLDTVQHGFFPRVFATSVYDDYNEALAHLNKRLIFTKEPEQIRDGGLLRYCYLQVCGFRPADPTIMKSQEPYMCTRFFLDYNLTNSQRIRITTYMFTRFVPSRELALCNAFLDTLLTVVSRSCKESGRQQTMKQVVRQIKYNVLGPYQATEHVMMPMPTAMMPMPTACMMPMPTACMMPMPTVVMPMSFYQATHSPMMTPELWQMQGSFPMSSLMPSCHVQSSNPPQRYSYTRKQNQKRHIKRKDSGGNIRQP